MKASETYTSPFLEGLHFLQLSLHETAVAMENAIEADDFLKVRQHRDEMEQLSEQVKARKLRSDLSVDQLHEKANDIKQRFDARYRDLKDIMRKRPSSVTQP